jgi:hypothetical protein
MNLNKAGGLTNMQIISYVATTLVAALAVTLGAQYLTEIDRVTPGSSWRPLKWCNSPGTPTPV